MLSVRWVPRRRGGESDDSFAASLRPRVVASAAPVIERMAEALAELAAGENGAAQNDCRAYAELMAQAV